MTFGLERGNCVNDSQLYRKQRGGYKECNTAGLRPPGNLGITLCQVEFVLDVFLVPVWKFVLEVTALPGDLDALAL